MIATSIVRSWAKQLASESILVNGVAPLLEPLQVRSATMKN
ncbi:hypothetical protein [Adhaeribacter rhizoryzae]|nr:hypothetical protein [Adhaeribacter rhizoryzae]